MAKLRVVVDVSVVGLAQLYETARTGIYRVISSLIPAMVQLPGPELRFTSLSSTEINLLTEAYFRDHAWSEHFLGPGIAERRLFALARSANVLDRKQILQRLVARLFRKSNQRALTASMDIFHSTFGPIPQLRDWPMSFLTIYDMIPVLHPEYFWQDFDAEFTRILDSVHPGRDRILTISESSKNDICAYFNCDPSLVYVAYPAADRSLYFPDRDERRRHMILQKYNIPGAGYFLTLATLEYRKNLRASIEAFRKVLREPGMRDRSLVLVGTRGWKIRELLDEVASDPLLQQRVLFTGYVADEDVSALYSNAVAFLYPSLYEGFGLPPLEAMQCGVPVITSNTSSLPEVVGQAGIMVKPTDTDALAQAMLDICNDAALRDRMIERGLQQASRFSWHRCARQTVAAYEHAFSGRQASGERSGGY